MKIVTHGNVHIFGKFRVMPTERHRRREMHDVFIVISEGGYGEHVARTIHAASEDDARQTHQDNYPDEPIVAVHQ